MFNDRNKYKIQWLLEEVMYQKRITAAQLADELDVHPNTVTRIKNSKSKTMPSIDGLLLAKLCAILDCTPSDLIRYAPEDEIEGKEIERKNDLKDLENDDLEEQVINILRPSVKLIANYIKTTYSK
ncbi:MAG: helix-turn-helix transcriptional regulator [Dolichospermum sp. DL01]|jgi:DNA-binding Xre family transcriptional regulator|nr:MAG: helix-turn-helix transcriptional regulator [Dolichospermum sp. DL01]